MLRSSILLFLGIQIIFADNCRRPHDLRSKEDMCYKSEVELVDRIQQTSKSVLNFAKKKLGMETEENMEEQKCTYYQCILNKLKLIENGFPIIENFEKWVESEVVYDQAKKFLNQLHICNDEMVKATSADMTFYGDFQTRNITDVEIEKKYQNDCELALQLIKCLSHQDGCPVFIFP